MKIRNVLNHSKIIKIIVLICLLFFLSEASSHTSAKNKKLKYPNVLLITIDALRTDHLGCYGYTKNTSPNIDKFSQKGVLFINNTSQSHSTGPSCSSIMTSTYLKNHGVLNLATFGYRLDDSFTTLAEVLKKYGYVTAAAVGCQHVLNKIIRDDFDSGIGQGFDIFYDNMRKKLRFDAKEINQFVIPWLKKHSPKKFFLWIHYFDVHGPYIPPKSYSAKFYSSNNRQSIPLELIPPYQRHRDSNTAIITELNYYIAQYNGAINFVDEQISALLDEFKKLGIFNNTIIIITADHGESLGEHDIYFQHRPIYEDVLRVPLIISGPGIPSNIRIESLTQNIDIMPTILDILEIPLHEEMEGVSLMPLIYGEKEEVHKEVFSESVDNRAKVIKTKEWKLIYNLENNQIELYNLKNDPKELHNVADKFPLVAKDLENRLQNFLNKGVDTPPI